MTTLQDLFLTNNPNPNSVKTFSKGQQFKMKDNVAFIISGIVSTDVLLLSGDTSTLWLSGESEYLNMEAVNNPSLLEDRIYTIDSPNVTLAFLNTKHLREKVNEETSEGYKLYKEYSKTLVQYLAQLRDTHKAAIGLKTNLDRLRWAMARLEDLSPIPYPLTRKRLGSHIFSNDLSVSKLIKIIREDNTLTPYMRVVFSTSAINKLESF